MTALGGKSVREVKTSVGQHVKEIHREPTNMTSCTNMLALHSNFPAPDSVLYLFMEKVIHLFFLILEILSGNNDLN
jgi:hypothetical protein